MLHLVFPIPHSVLSTIQVKSSVNISADVGWLLHCRDAPRVFIAPLWLRCLLFCHRDWFGVQPCPIDNFCMWFGTGWIVYNVSRQLSHVFFREIIPGNRDTFENSPHSLRLILKHAFILSPRWCSPSLRLSPNPLWPLIQLLKQNGVKMFWCQNKEALAWVSSGQSRRPAFPKICVTTHFCVCGLHPYDPFSDYDPRPESFWKQICQLRNVFRWCDSGRRKLQTLGGNFPC